MPLGHHGVLKLINSYKVNTALGILVPQKNLERFKEWAGWGYTIIVLAQKKS